jgi:hypothetical protein
MFLKVFFSSISQGQTLKTRNSTKIIKSNQSLVLQKVTRFSAGKYSCSARNSEGETVSNELLLKVKFIPQCAVNMRMMVVGATKGKSIKLTCEIRAYPLPEHFYWKFESSEESVDIDQKNFSIEGNSSVLMFSTTTEHVSAQPKYVDEVIKTFNPLCSTGLWKSFVLGEE